MVGITERKGKQIPRSLRGVGGQEGQEDRVLEVQEEERGKGGGQLPRGRTHI